MKPSESTDPEVHQLLAQREILAQHDRQYLDGVEPAKQAHADRQKQHADIDARLAELGYTTT